MKKLFALAVLLVLGITNAPSFAGHSSQQITQNVNCQAPQTTQEMLICGDRAYKAADKKLNQVYQALQPKLNANQKKRLTNAQLAWIKFRDAACAFEGGIYAGGSLESPTRINCLARITEQRTKDLNLLLQQLNRR
ncbi:MAG: DUF1311 domain-containing protein [Fischerella sp.]|jgi:uncharacterized protein YecT (DUF1311 family)|uniref:lysozyme inhibitor LprI family protein n=1 Tax=Fischerella sp. TaxID=1191 RepID=UPI0018354E8D|nr:lysozyme inhibitor LprI family protein [Fischerella sp.]NWF59088.1 DUF1311 domain-containing protein [Fischerella sp.]